jgi:hypothetical protein
MGSPTNLGNLERARLGAGLPITHWHTILATGQAGNGRIDLPYIA